MSRNEIFGLLKNICSSWDIIVYADNHLQFYIKEDEFSGFLTNSMYGVTMLRNFVEGASAGEWTLKVNLPYTKEFTLVKVSR